MSPTLFTHRAVTTQLSHRIWRYWLALGRAQIFKSPAGLLQLGIEAADAEPDQGCFHSVDNPSLLSDEALALAVGPLGILVLARRDRHHLAVITWSITRRLLETIQACLLDLADLITDQPTTIQRVGARAIRLRRLLARVIGVGIETADMLVQEVLARNMRDRRAIARYAGLTGSPDESGTKRREKGLARSGNARVRRGMIQLAWRFLLFQKNSALAQWFRARTENARGTRKPMIVALARKLLIALWRLVREGVVPDGVVLRPTQ